ncbi:MAG: RdgB/HAM1 family non-canonical purine NTP pyrophosphatase [Brevefilum sp.]|nr:RdgB/HAM1 family non-canonical purine NTP pyrophosphatase [Brevefilum sp.]
MHQTLLIASGNPGKLHEIKAILASLEIQVLSAADIDLDLQVQETGTTYGENARLKAQAYLSATGLPVIADDSGLEVDVLEGAPGIYSARFSPIQDASDADRRAHLLAELKGKSQPWQAHFHCTAVLALPSGECIERVGRCEGIIIPEERGSGGFGYDPLFYLPEFNATMAELPAEVKNRVSHRARALSALLPILQNRLIES